MSKADIGGRVALLVVLYAVLPVLFIALYFIGNLYSISALFEAYNLSIIAGAAAYVVFMTQLLLAARIPFFERIIPQDKLLALHGLTGMIAGGLVLVHFILKYLLIIMPGGSTVQSTLGLVALIIFVFLGPGAIFVLRGRSGRSKIRKKGTKPRKIRYQRNKMLHNLFALAGALAVVHVIMASSTWSAALRIFTIVWGVLTLGAYVFHKIIRPRRRDIFKVQKVTAVGKNIHRYVFSVDEARRLGSRNAGQFGYWSMEDSSLGKEEHPFTLASPPSAAPEIVVRASGDYTSQLPSVRKGTVVRFDGPYGHFYPRGLKDGTPLVAIAGGIGITPFLSLIQDDEIRRRYPIHLLWSIHSAEDAAAGEVLKTFADQGEIDLRIVDTSQDGRVQKHDLAGLFDAAGNKSGQGDGETRNSAVFLCGPDGFTNAMRKYLTELGVKKKHIHEERFGW